MVFITFSLNCFLLICEFSPCTLNELGLYNMPFKRHLQLARSIPACVCVNVV